MPRSGSAADQDFTLVNKTGFDIHSVFISPHGIEEWQEDVLGRAVLANGYHVDLGKAYAAKVTRNFSRSWK